MPKELLTDEGKKWARYLFLTHHYTSNIPYFGKWIAATAVSLAYSTLLKEGAKEHARRKAIARAKVSRMRNQASIDRGEATGEMREMRFRPSGVQRLQTMESSAPEGTGSRAQTEETNREERI